jgi:3-hydroxyacyl-[acyl-carrier-protein] dehydratase
MPTAPLVDFDAQELTEVIVSKEEIYRSLKQADTFALLDGVLLMDRERDLAVGFKDIRADDWWVKGHIPGRPLFPGALMIETGAQLASYDFMKRSPDWPEDRFLGFGGTGPTRFRETVVPGQRMIFAARVQRIRSRMFTYDVQGFVDGRLAFETEILGIVV